MFDPLIIEPQRLDHLETEFLRYKRNAQRCGHWPYLPLRLHLIKYLLEINGRIQALGQEEQAA